MSFISFIGCGNMGKGMLTALCNNDNINRKDIIISEPDETKLNEVTAEFGCQGVSSNIEAVKMSKYIMLCVKPQVLPDVLAGIAPTLAECIANGEEKIILSIAAGTTIEKIQTVAGISADKLPIIRILPNLPAAIGEGLIFFSIHADNAEAPLSEIMNAFDKAGMLERIPESQMDVAGVIGGCVPAFAYMFIEAMADGAVLCGMPRAQTIAYAAQAVKGAAGLVIASDKHPEQLKDEVCSPAGTTIEGVKALEEHGFRNAAFSAVTKAYDKSVSLSNKK